MSQNEVSEEMTYDTDAVLSGEAEGTDRRFEEYFGLPSQREPAGHVPGPALLATRINSQAVSPGGVCDVKCPSV